MATQTFHRLAVVCSIAAFVLMFVAFASPYWYKSWTRVHSSFGTIGLWRVCLSGYIIPRDPVMKSYVGCWWIHSSEFERVANNIMPAWFRIIQLLCVLTLLLDLAAVVLTLIHFLEQLRIKCFSSTGVMFIVDSILMLVAALFVFLIALIFAEMSHDSSWMPRPWMNYLSWSYGLCVLSGFLSAFGGILVFILGLVFLDKENRDVDNLDSAAEMRRREVELKNPQSLAPSYTAKPAGQTQIASTRFSPPEELEYRGARAVPPPTTSVPSKPVARVGESFV